MKGLFIPEITAEMFRNGSLESIEALMAEGEIYDIDYQQPCEDCISREDAIRIASIHSMPVNECVRLIKKLPSVTPQRPKGKWIDDAIENEDTNLPIQACSICKTFYPLSYTGGGHNYCPNCGAKMEVEE